MARLFSNENVSATPSFRERLRPKIVRKDKPMPDSSGFFFSLSVAFLIAFLIGTLVSVSMLGKGVFNVPGIVLLLAASGTFIGGVVVMLFSGRRS